MFIHKLDNMHVNLMTAEPSQWQAGVRTSKDAQSQRSVRLEVRYICDPPPFLSYLLAAEGFRVTGWRSARSQYAPLCITSVQHK